MDQTGALADSLLKGTSLSSGLFAQSDTSSTGNSALDGLFSNILSQNESFDASFAPTPVATPVTAAASFSSTSSVTSGSTLLTNLTTLSSALHQALAALNAERAQQSQAKASQNAQTSETASSQSSVTPTQTLSSSAQAAASPPTSTSPSGAVSSKTAFGATVQVYVFKKATVSASSNATNSDGATDNTSSTASGAQPTSQSLTDVISELLTLTQLMIKNLEAIQSASGGTSVAAGTAAGQAQAVAGAAVDTGADAPGTASAGTGSSTSTDPLLQLISALEKTTQTLAPISAGTAQTQNLTSAQAVGTSALGPTTLSELETDLSTITKDILGALDKQQNLGVASAQTPSSAPVASQLAALDTGLKGIIAALQAKLTATTSAPVKTVLTPATLNLDPLAVATIPSGQTLSFTPVSKSLASVETEKATSNAQIAQAENAAAGAASSKTTAASTASQTALTTATLVANADKNGGGADLSDNSNSFSSQSNASSSNLGFGATAGGAQASGTYNFASTLSALRATNGGATGLPTVVDQVILQMNRNVKSGNDTMSLQLTPGDLGKITVKLDISSDGKVQGTVTAENSQTLGMLQKDSRSLERALQDAGLRADPGSLQFNLGGQGGQNAGNTGNQAGSNEGRIAADGTISAEDSLGLSDLGSVPETYYVTSSGVNIQV